MASFAVIPALGLALGGLEINIKALVSLLTEIHQELGTAGGECLGYCFSFPPRETPSFLFHWEDAAAFRARDRLSARRFRSCNLRVSARQRLLTSFESAGVAMSSIAATEALFHRSSTISYGGHYRRECRVVLRFSLTQATVCKCTQKIFPIGYRYKVYHGIRIWERTL